MRNHLMKKKPCNSLYHNYSREELLTKLDSSVDMNNKTCSKCKVTFVKYEGLVYHCLNNVCTPNAVYRVEVQHKDTDHDTQAMIEADTVEFGTEDTHHVPISVILESFGTTMFDPLVVKYVYFHSEQPQNQSILYLGNAVVAIKKQSGWESRPWKAVARVMISKLALELTTHPQMAEAKERGVIPNLESTIEYWRSFHTTSSKNEDYQRVSESMLHVVKTYTTPERLAQIKKYLDVRL